MQIQHPRNLITDAVNDAVIAAFNLSKKMRLVRQRKIMNFGTLKFVDYAVPCFELAKELGLNPEEVAKKLADRVKNNSLSDYNYSVEAVAGYVNFEIKNEYLINLLSNVNDWYGTHEENFEKEELNFLVLSSKALKGSKDINREACLFIQDAYRKSGRKSSINYLVEDYSEETINSIVEFMIQKETTLNQGVVRRTLRKTLQNRENYSDLDSYKSLFLSTEDGWPEYSVNNIFESDLVHDVHTFIEEMGTEYPSNMILDPVSQAAYFIDPNTAVSVRTSNGILYRAAYILFLLHSILKKSVIQNQKLVIVSPQGMHSFVKSIAALVSEKDVICFDPNVSRADIHDLSTTQHPTDLYDRIRDSIVQPHLKASLNSVQTRHTILALLDFPKEVEECLSKLHMPAVLDLLNQSRVAAETLRT